MPNIRHEIVIAATADKIYEAITRQERLSAWWTPETDAKAELNSHARFGFGPAYFKEMKIEQLKPFEKVQWICIKGAEEWIGTIISFELHSGQEQTLLDCHPEAKDQIKQQKKTNESTVLIFHHDHWKDYTPMFAECNYTWGQFLRSLKLLCETGKGHPWPNQHRTNPV